MEERRKLIKIPDVVKSRPEFEMINLSVHSQNLRGSLKNCIDNLHNRINNLDCECTAICLQDLGPTGPDGPPLLRQSLGEHSIL